jgi:hypothetical protein
MFVTHPLDDRTFQDEAEKPGDYSTSMVSRVTGAFRGYVKSRRQTVGNAPHLTAAQVQARPLVSIPPDNLSQPQFVVPQPRSGPQGAPDPIRQSQFDGVGHLGKARIPKTVFVYDQTAWEQQSFLASKHRFAQRASVPFGHMLPDANRVNIVVPGHTSYGQIAEYQPAPYGYIE